MKVYKILWLICLLISTNLLADESQDLTEESSRPAGLAVRIDGAANSITVFQISKDIKAEMTKSDESAKLAIEKISKPENVLKTGKAIDKNLEKSEKNELDNDVSTPSWYYYYYGSYNYYYPYMNYCNTYYNYNYSYNYSWYYGYAYGQNHWYFYY